MKPYVTRSKTDALDAHAIGEAMWRTDLNFVLVKSARQQALQTVHKVRESPIRERTMTISAVRAHLAEFGWYGDPGRGGFGCLVTHLRAHDYHDLPPTLIKCVELLIKNMLRLDGKIDELKKELVTMRTAARTVSVC